MNKTIHKILRFFIRLMFKAISRMELVGFENLPATQSFVIAANHIGRLDAALAYYALDRSDIIVMVAEKYERFALTRWLTRLVNGIFLDRYNTDIGALRETLRRLQHGGILVITPEGTRSMSGNLIEAKPGGLYLALKAGVPILPVALTGTEDAVVMEKLKHFKRLEIKVVAGPSFTLPSVIAKYREAALKKYTNDLMYRIAALLPEERRGVYAENPRLSEMPRK